MTAAATARIAWMPAGDRSLPGSRLRAYIPADSLRSVGWNTAIVDPRRAEHWDIVVFQKIYQRDTIALARSLKERGTKLVFDLCDNHFYNPDDAPKLRDRTQRLQEMIDLMDAVSVSTSEIAKLIRNTRAVVIDDPIDYPTISRWLGLRLKAASLFRGTRPSRLRVVWHGTAGQSQPPTGIIDVQRVLPELEELNRTVPLSLTVISNSRKQFRRCIHGASFPIRYVTWRLSSFPYHIRQHDLCVIPISINPFTICKTNNRLVSSLLFGLPVIADPITSYEEFSDCVLFGNWSESLLRYARDPELRREHVRRAIDYIRSKYTPDRVVIQWSTLFGELLDSRPAPVEARSAGAGR